MEIIGSLKKALKNLNGEGGFALPVALVLLLIGGLLVVPSSSLTYTSITANRAADEMDRNIYTADAGIEYAYWQIKNNTSLQLPATGQQISLPFSDTVNGRTPTITISNQNGTTFRIASTASGSSGNSVTVISDVDLTFSGGVGLFDNALVGLSGNIAFAGNTVVTASTPGGADIYAGGSPGNIVLAGGVYVDGDASAVGTITVDGSATITGVQYQGAPPLQPPPDIDVWVQNCRSQTLALTCPAVTRSGNWSITGSGNITYPNAERISGDLSISRSGTVTFSQAVCVDGNLTISSSANVVFLGPVKVNGYVSIISNNTVRFDSTTYVGGSFATQQNAIINVGDTMYIAGSITMAGNRNAAFKKVYLTKSSPILAEGNISLTGNAVTHTSVVLDLPIIVSVNGNINLFGASGSGARWVEAVLYSIHGSISLSNNGLLCGCAIATEYLTTGNSSVIYYLTGIGGRGDLPGNGGGGVESTVSSMTPRTYSVQ
jgi:hypothetical protein